MSAVREKLPNWATYVLLPLVNLAAAFLVSGLVVMFIGENPLEAVKLLIWGAFGFQEAIGYTLFYTTNFIFTGLAVAVAAHAGLFNIGGEGQAYVAGLGVALAALYVDFLPIWLFLPLVIVLSALFGAAWALIPAWLQATRGSHVVITTIMFNFIAAALMVYLLVNVLSPVGSMAPETRTFAPGGTLPFMHEMLAGLGISFAKTPLNISFLWAVAVSIFVWALVWHSRFGYELRTVGLNPAAAVYAGISTTRVIVITMMISGALAGFMALNEVVGAQQRLLLEFTSGYGFVGIAVALMGRSHPIGIVLAALLFGALYQGGAELAFEIPAITRDMVVVIQGLVILFAGALEYMFQPQLEALFSAFRRRAKESRA